MLLCSSVNTQTGTSVAGSKKAEQTGKDAEWRLFQSLPHCDMLTY